MFRIILIVGLIGIFAVGIQAQTTAFNYQGSLKDGASPANGLYDFQIALYDAVSAGNPLGPTLTYNSVVVANGIFSVSLDFGSQFPGANRFLEIRVRLNGQPGFTTLTPRQPVNSQPYSVKSLSADSVGGIAPTGFIQNGTSLQIASQNISGNAFFGGQVGIGTTSVGSPKLTVQGTGSVGAIFGLSTSGIGVTGASDTSFGVNGSSVSGTGTRGISESGIGVQGSSSNGLAGDFSGPVNISGKVAIGTTTSLTAKLDVAGGTLATAITGRGENTGVYGLSTGSSTSSRGVYGDSTNGTGVYGLSTAVGATVAGVRGVNLASGGNGVIGEAGGGTGTGVYGVSTSATGYGVVGRNLSGGYAGYFDGTSAVIGFLDITQYTAGGATSVCRNGVRLAACSSSLRYKTNIGRFSQGMSFVDQLRPISFDWKDGGMKDVGFGAEDVAKIDSRFVTYNEKGEVEGVKYDRVSVVLVNAVKEQQQQIETQQKQIEALTQALCSLKPELVVCKSSD